MTNGAGKALPESLRFEIRHSVFDIRYDFEALPSLVPAARGSAGGRKDLVEDTGENDIPLLTKHEAIAEIRRWLEVEKVDPEKIFAAFGETTIRYKDLIPHLEEDTPDGKLLLFAISRGRAMKKSRDRELEAMLQIIIPPPPSRKEPSA